MEEHERSVAEIVTRKLGDDNVPDQVAALILDAMSEHARDAGAGEGEPAVAQDRVSCIGIQNRLLCTYQVWHRRVLARRADRRFRPYKRCLCLP